MKRVSITWSEGVLCARTQVFTGGEQNLTCCLSFECDVVSNEGLNQQILICNPSAMTDMIHMHKHGGISGEIDNIKGPALGDSVLWVENQTRWNGQVTGRGTTAVCTYRTTAKKAVVHGTNKTLGCFLPCSARNRQRGRRRGLRFSRSCAGTSRDRRWR